MSETHNAISEEISEHIREAAAALDTSNSFGPSEDARVYIGDAIANALIAIAKGLVNLDDTLREQK